MRVAVRIYYNVQRWPIKAVLLRLNKAFSWYCCRIMNCFFYADLRTFLVCFFMLLGPWSLTGKTLAFGVGALGAKAVHSKRNQSLERQEWINNAVGLLKTKSPADSSIYLHRQVFEQDGYSKISYTLDSEDGYITFPKGEWLYMLVHSEQSSEAIGDITLAIDHRGKLYINKGHVRRGVISFFTDVVARITSVADFIRYCKADTNDELRTIFQQ